MSEKLDLSDKENWTLKNAAEIALILGFPLNDWFLGVLENYINESVKSAEVTDYLTIFAIREFNHAARERNAEKVTV